LAGLLPKEEEPFFNHAMNPNAAAVSLVTGSSSQTEARDSIFTGFNSPLLPDILVCTAVGQEGIDLHRHCRHVVHYDLGWNPAILEQRTGRTDGLGSKAIRERNSEIRAQWENGNQIDESSLPGLDIAIPYLAATYDERVFNRLRKRALVFEILTGGDPSADQDAEVNWVEPNDEVVNSNAGFVQLPEELLESLRVRLDISPSI
jgi:superfamily II DNA/RNA helicase